MGVVTIEVDERRRMNNEDTLKTRTQSPATKVFIECAREVAKPLAARHSVGPGPQKRQTT